MKREYFAPTLARLAYITDKNALKTALSGLGFTLIETYDINEMQAYLCECDEGQVLSFRGSEFSFTNLIKLWDWIRNFQIELKDTFIGNVHTGYYNILEKTYDTLNAKITDKNLIIASHSQGAGLGTIFAKMINVADGYNAKFFSFEPPRISDTHKFNKNGFYTVNSSDIVPRVPLRVMDYRHNGTLIYFNRGGKYKKRARIEKLIDFILDVKDTFKDHEISFVEKNWHSNWEEIQKTIRDS